METDVATLLARAADGDQRAWDEIVERFSNLLWAIGRAHRLDQTVILDVVQTTWLRLLENLRRIREPERLAGWLATTARRECLSALRASGRETTGWEDDQFAALPDQAAAELDVSLLDEERDAALWRCFGQLSEACQRLLGVLMTVDPPSYQEVSEAVGIKVGSIGPTRMRCLKSLRGLLKESGYPFDTGLGRA